MKKHKSNSSGFTLIEMLVVIAVIALLAAIIVPSVNRSLASAKRSQCTSNLRQVGLAITGYAMDNRTYLPPVRDGGWSAGVHWMEIISPYLGPEVGHISDGQGVVAISRACPAWREPNPTKPGYGMNPFPAAFSARFPNGNGQANFSRNFLQITDIDTPSRAILVGDSVDWHLALMSNNWWPANNQWGYLSAHPDRHGRVANYLMVDGSVTPLTKADALTRLRNPNNS